MSQATPAADRCPFAHGASPATPTERLPRGRRAPGPRGWPLVGSLPAMRRDVLGLMLRGMHEHGDVVRYRIGPSTVHLLCHPDDIAHVFTHHDRYDKATLASARIRQVTGDGLLVSNGEPWADQRRAIQPAFSSDRVAAFLPLIVEQTQRMLDRWEQAARSGEAIDVASQMMRLTYGIVEQALFSTEATQQVGEIERAITTAMAHTYRRIENPLSVPAFVPTPANRRFRRAMRTLDDRVQQIIADHRAGRGRDDLLSDLMQRGRSSGCPHFNDRALRNQTITLLLAGHETTANALTWLWHLLGAHGDVADQVHDEAQAVLGDGGPPTMVGVNALQYTSMALRESMRLYTPIWAIVRRVVTDDEVGGYRLRRGTRIVISPYVTHRHGEFWPDAERFDPTRFAAEQTRAMHRCAYIPFGGGRRFCVGRNLAMLEGVVIAAMVARRFRLRLAPGQRVEMSPGITLRARHGLRMTLQRRGCFT